LSSKKFRTIKSEIRVLGVDDGMFTPHVKGSALTVGVVFRGGCWLDGVMSTKVEVDGFDATDKIASMVNSSQHHKQLRIIMLDGVTFAGFNIVDMKKLFAETRLPVIAVTRDEPDFDDIHKALKNLPRSEERWKAIQNAGKITKVYTRGRKEKVYIGIAGIQEEDAEKVVRLTSTRSSIPEPLRVAHLIASGTSALWL
jgi:endonuclease V-like protein UPF0215 family